MLQYNYRSIAAGNLLIWGGKKQLELNKLWIKKEVTNGLQWLREHGNLNFYKDLLCLLYLC